MEFTVKSSLVIEPDGVYMLEGARVPMKLVESVKTKEGPIKKGKSVCEGERERGREGERERGREGERGSSNEVGRKNHLNKHYFVLLQRVTILVQLVICGYSCDYQKVETSCLKLKKN